MTALKTAQLFVELINSASSEKLAELMTENHWQVPAAWRVEVEDDRVAVWQLYVNQKSMIKIHNRIVQS